MGYSASSIQISDAIVLPAARFGELLDTAIAETKADKYMSGRWSWTDQLDTYSRDAEGIAKLFEDYGFLCDIDENGDVRLESWGGDKLGSSADHVWSILADRKSTRLNSSHRLLSRMPSSA